VSSDTKLRGTERWLVFGDQHQQANKPHHPSYELAKNFAFEVAEWDLIVQLGDSLELDYFASFNADSAEILAEGNFKADTEMLSRELDDWQALADVILLQGNHDERADRVGERYPALKDLLDYDLAMDLPNRGIEFVRQVNQPKTIGKLMFAHGWYANKYAAATHLEKLGGNIVIGHVHKFQTFSKGVPFRSSENQGWSLGCLCGLLPEWKKGAPTWWQNGFAVVYVDRETQNFNLYPVNIIDGAFMFEGRRWSL